MGFSGFQVAYDAMQVDIDKTLCPFYTTKKRPMFR